MWDGSGSLFALGMRLCKLDVSGTPVPGAGNGYKTDAMVQISVGIEMRDGISIEQPNGSGNICLGFSAPKTVKGGTISDLQVCSPDPLLLPFLQGGETITSGSAGTAEVQTLTITNATDGTYTLLFDGEPTTALDHDANAAAIEAALLALDAIGVGEVTVTGTGPYTITFTIPQGNVPQLVATNNLVGVGATVEVETTTPGTNLTDIGYAAPRVGVSPVPYGVGLEFWTAAIDDGSYATELPYIRWVIGRAKLVPSESWTAGGENPMLPGFEGTTEENRNYGDGPLNDWQYISSRIWQFVRVAELPDLSPGTFEVLA